MNQFEQIFKKIIVLLPNIDKMEAGQAAKLTSAGFMDLHVDVLSIEQDRTVISMAHYYEQNGDKVPDPDMEIALYPKFKMAEALTYQDSFGFKEVYPEPGKVYPTIKKELNSFLNQWLNNIKSQRFFLEGHRIEKGQGRKL